MEKSWWITRFFKWNFLIMKVTVELHGATTVSYTHLWAHETGRNLVCRLLLEKKFKGNHNLKKLIESSAFCSEDDEIISENYKMNENQKIGIIPPIGGG